VPGRGGLSGNIDGVLSGAGGVGKGRGVGRRGMSNIGDGTGYGGGEGGIDDLGPDLTPAGSSTKIGAGTQPATTWKRSGISPNSSKLTVGETDSLPLKGMQISATIDGIRARVLVDCYYANDRSRQLEGTFRLRLPSGASPYFFAFGNVVLMDRDDKTGNVPFVRYRSQDHIDLNPGDVMGLRRDSWQNVKEARMVPNAQAAYAYHEVKTCKPSSPPAPRTS